MSRSDKIEGLLREKLTPTRLEVEDDSASHAGHAGASEGGGHFNVTIVAPAFAGRSRVERHRMVYTALGDMMPTEIHALAVRAFTPDEDS
ncbi:MAG: BolA family protein [Deltaproteobacteria bacterium]